MHYEVPIPYLGTELRLIGHDGDDVNLPAGQFSHAEPWVI
jgi:hypothetical protein